jgi:hypothetical protein
MTTTRDREISGGTNLARQARRTEAKGEDTRTSSRNLLLCSRIAAHLLARESHPSLLNPLPFFASRHPSLSSPPHLDPLSTRPLSKTLPRATCAASSASTSVLESIITLKNNCYSVEPQPPLFTRVSWQRSIQPTLDAPISIVFPRPVFFFPRTHPSQPNAHSDQEVDYLGRRRAGTPVATIVLCVLTTLAN